MGERRPSPSRGTFISPGWWQLYDFTEKTHGRCFYKIDRLLRYFQGQWHRKRGTILWSRSLIKLGSGKRDVITMRGNWLSFTWSIPSHCILTCYPLHFFIRNGPQWGSYSSCGKDLCVCCLTCSPGKFSKLGAFELHCSYLAQVEGLPHHFLLLEVLSSFRSELPFVLKGVCFAVRCLRETGWWWPWLPQHRSCTSRGPQGMCKFIPKSYDSAWVSCSPFLLTGAEEAAEDRTPSFFKIFFPSCSHWSFFFLCHFALICFPLDFSLAVTCANSFLLLDHILVLIFLLFHFFSFFPKIIKSFPSPVPPLS